MNWVDAIVGLMLWPALGAVGWASVLYQSAKKGNTAPIDGEDIQALWIAMIFGPITFVIIWLGREDR